MFFFSFTWDDSTPPVWQRFHVRTFVFKRNAAISLGRASFGIKSAHENERSWKEIASIAHRQRNLRPNFTISDQVSELLYLDSMAVVSTTAAIKKRSKRKGQVLKDLSWHIWHEVDDHCQLANVVLHTYRFIKTRAIRITCKSSVE